MSKRNPRGIYSNAGVKVLPLQQWMKRPDVGNFPNLETTTPRFNRDGYYRHYDVCWFEHNGIAYLYDVEMFKRAFKSTEARLLTAKETECIKYLAVRKLASKEQLKQLRISKEIKILNKMHIFNMIRRKRIGILK